MGLGGGQLLLELLDGHLGLAGGLVGGDRGAGGPLDLGGVSEVAGLAGLGVLSQAWVGTVGAGPGVGVDGWDVGDDQTGDAHGQEQAQQQREGQPPPPVAASPGRSAPPSACQRRAPRQPVRTCRLPAGGNR